MVFVCSNEIHNAHEQTHFADSANYTQEVQEVHVSSQLTCGGENLSLWRVRRINRGM